jgi:hypothetical protein
VAQVKKRAAKRTSSDDRVELIIKDGQGYIVARGVEQPDNFEKGVYVEVGPRHTVAFKITQAEAIDAAIMMLGAAGLHLKECSGHQEVLMKLLEELGIVESVELPK